MLRHRGCCPTRLPVCNPCAITLLLPPVCKLVAMAPSGSSLPLHHLSITTGLGVLRKPKSSERNCMCINGFRWVRGCKGPDPPSWLPFPDPMAWLGPQQLEVLLQWIARQSFNVRDALSALHGTCLLDGCWPYERVYQPFVRSFSSSCGVSSHPPHQGNLVGELV